MFTLGTKMTKSAPGRDCRWEEGGSNISSRILPLLPLVSLRSKRSRKVTYVTCQDWRVVTFFLCMYSTSYSKITHSLLKTQPKHETDTFDVTSLASVFVNLVL